MIKILTDKNEMKGLLDFTDENNIQMILPFEYDEIKFIDTSDSKESNIILLEKDNNKGLYNIDLKRHIVPCKYPGIKYTSFFNIIKVKNNDNKVGVYNTEGTKIIPCEYDNLFRFGNFYIVVLNKKYGIFTNENKVILPFEYDRIRFSYSFQYNTGSDVVYIEKDGKKGVYDIYNNKFIKECKYDKINIIKSLILGYDAKISKYKILNRDIDIDFDNIRYFELNNSISYIGENDFKYYYLTDKNESIIELESHATRIKDDLAVFYYNTKKNIYFIEISDSLYKAEDILDKDRFEKFKTIIENNK